MNRLMTRAQRSLTSMTSWPQAFDDGGLGASASRVYVTPEEAEEAEEAEETVEVTAESPEPEEETATEEAPAEEDAEEEPRSGLRNRRPSGKTSHRRRRTRGGVAVED